MKAWKQSNTFNIALGGSSGVAMYELPFKIKSCNQQGNQKEPKYM